MIQYSEGKVGEVMPGKRDTLLLHGIWDNGYGPSSHTKDVKRGATIRTDILYNTSDYLCSRESQLQVMDNQMHDTDIVPKMWTPKYR